MEKMFKFRGYNSGDYECFCFAVPEEDYVHLKGESPGEFDANPFHKDLFNFYPNDLVNHLNKDVEYAYEIIIRAVPLK